MLPSHGDHYARRREERVNPVSRNLGLWLLLLLMGLLLWSIVTKQQPREPEVSFSRFVQAVDEGRVAEVTIQGKSIRGRYRGEHGEKGELGEGFKTFAPDDPDLVVYRRGGVVVVLNMSDHERNLQAELVKGLRVLVSSLVDDTGAGQPAGAAEQVDTVLRQPALLAGVGIVRHHEVPPRQHVLNVDLCAGTGVECAVHRFPRA